MIVKIKFMTSGIVFPLKEQLVQMTLGLNEI